MFCGDSFIEVCEYRAPGGNRVTYTIQRFQMPDSPPSRFNAIESFNGGMGSTFMLVGSGVSRGDLGMDFINQSTLEIE